MTSSLESSEFQPICRAQVTCSAVRPCTYFALDSRGQRVFVKGPYRSKAEAEMPVNLAKLKCRLGLPFIELKLCQFIPDLYPDVPLGVRANLTPLQRTEPAWFVQSQSLLTESTIPTKIKETKLWKSTQVVDWDRVTSVTLVDSLAASTSNPDVYAKYVQGILWRYVMGIPDPADRNFLLVRDPNGQSTVYSTDEEGRDSLTNYVNGLRKVKCLALCKYIHSNYSQLHELFSSWERASNNESLMFGCSGRLRILLKGAESACAPFTQ